MSAPFLVKDIYPGSNSSLDSNYPLPITAVGNTLYFVAEDGVNGYELWKSNGTAAGTTLLKDILPGSGFPYTYPSSPVALGNTLYFNADDGVNGRELWKSDGTTAGTTLLKDIYTGSNFGFPNSSYPSNLTAVGNTLYFSAYGGVNRPLAH
jgi:ELWxxDGT repeat protein